MTRDDIIRMAREADLTYTPQAGWVVGSVQRLEAFATFVAAATLDEVADMVGACDPRATPKGIAAAIRARGEK